MDVLGLVAKWPLRALVSAVTLVLFVIGAWASVLSANQALLRADGDTVRLSVSDTPALRERGLSGSRPLAMNQGMLFVFEQPGNYCFWMKDMQYSIDMVWLDDQFRVVHVEQNAAPSSYPDQFCPSASAKYVVELASHRAGELGLKRGAAVTILR